METTKWPAIAGFIAGTVYLACSIDTTFVLDRPIHSSIFVFSALSVAIIGLSRLIPRDEPKSYKEQHYDALPLEEVGQPHSSRQPSPTRADVRYPSSLRKLRLQHPILVAALCLRAEVLREIVSDSQCAIVSPQIFMPVSLAFWDYITVQRHRNRPFHNGPEASVYEVLQSALTRAPYRYLIAALMLSLGCSLAATSTSAPRSTYICAASLHHRWIVPNLQWLASSLDTTILFCIGQLLHPHEGRGARGLRLRFASVGWTFLASLFEKPHIGIQADTSQSSSIVLLLIGYVYFYVTPLDRDWIRALPALYFWSMVKIGVAVSLIGVCALLTIYHVGILTTSMLATFTAVATTTTTFAWNNPHAFPPISANLAFASICLAVLGLAIYFHVESASEERAAQTTFSKVPSWFYLFLLSFSFVRTGLWVSRSSTVSYHPIDMLIYDAAARHEAYINQTSASRTLEDAARHYRERYNRHPPPGFDHWYSYATARNSVVIDDYDSMYRDLLPFFAPTPAEIRHATWTMISNPHNDAAGISIRAGQVAISPRVVPTHKWMLDGVVEMISPFVMHLPDMDLAFNLNDEPRVVVQHERIEAMRDNARGKSRLAEKPSNAFSNDRSAQWLPIPEEPNQETPLEELSLERIFYEYANAGCPAKSPARTQRVWNTQRLCTACTSPQSLGAFLANWTIAADICHQPDLANLHGLYISPAAFKGAHDLYPIFSQSKAHGFNDILYPSAWNYVGKVKYEPNKEHQDAPFAEKNNTLFWRGATSEGMSTGMGQWKGMTRQRMIHLANQINNTGPSQPLLLPSPNPDSQKLAYVDFSLAELTALLNTDVHIVDAKLIDPNADSIVRCAGRDCSQQKVEFAPLYPPSDFQAHWQYKFLLDLDGAGFSGRFLPFLASRSLPFKAALFREWWDDRVTPWQHFVPLDVRGQGLWATLAYFAGVDGKVRGKVVKAEAHELAAELIASRGRNWANKVLRKEDMEIFMFRLLLEWGRLTDDARDSIGFGTED